MKVLLLAFLALAAAEQASPIEKVLQMLTDLAAKVVAEGEEAHKVFAEFAAHCDDTSKNLEFEIKTGEGNVAELNAEIDSQKSTIGALNAKIEELSAAIATDEADLAAATKVRGTENADFTAQEKELVEVIGMLERAIGILEKELKKGGAAMLQLQNAGGVVDALKVLVSASMFSSKDAQQLTAFVQSSSSDEDAGAPDAAVYENHSGGIIDTLNNLLEKANGELDSARKEESDSLHNFQMLEQSLNDSIKYANKDMAEAKQNLAAAQEAEATATGELEVTSKALASDKEDLADLHQECMKKAEDYEAATQDRNSELEALSKAKAVIAEATTGAASQTYGFVQISTSADLSNFEAVRFVRDLARKQGSSVLAQLASRMASTIRLGHGEADVFAKVKGLISDMIARLEEEAAADATEKAYCDKEMSETQAKKDEKQAEIDKLTAKIDNAKAKAAQLKEQVAQLQASLAALAQQQAEMDNIRTEEKELYAKNRPELEAGIKGVQVALKVLREYYSSDDKSHGAADGAAQGIIGLLEVCESDFSKGLAETIAAEESAAAEYDRQSKENEITKVTNEQDVKYKSQEAASLDKAVAENSADREGVQNELAALNEYWAQLTERCVAKAEPYAERKARREAEIAGLKEALNILENEAALIQTGTRRLRGVRAHQ